MYIEEEINTDKEFDKAYRIPFNQVEDWKAHLAENGFVVIANYLPREQAVKHFNQIWSMMEKLSLKKLIREDYETHRNKKNYPSSHHGGLIQYIGHSKTQWELRKRAKPIFDALWNTEDLKTSFDGVCFANGIIGYEKKSEHDGLHVDQNPENKELESYQGIMALSDAGDNSGGFVCVPKSHKYFSEYFKDYKGGPRSIPQEDRNKEPLSKYIKVNTRAGDFILFESRTFHCGTPPFNKNLRVCTYICMMPSKVVPEDKQLQRIDAFKKRSNSGHHCGENFRTFPWMPKKQPKAEWERNEFFKIIREVNQSESDELEKDPEIMRLI